MLLPCVGALIACCVSVVASATDVRFVGNVSYNFLGSSAMLAADRVQNFAATGSSAALRMELWAFAAPYDGSAMSGHKMTQYTLTPLSGGQVLQDVRSGVLPFLQPAEGTWHFSLLLTEQAGAPQNEGFITRHWVNFPLPVVFDFSLADPHWDVFWRSKDGVNAVWQFAGAAGSQINADFVPGVPTTWQARAVADIDGDLVRDVIWFEPATGNVAIWLMDGPDAIGAVPFPASVGANSPWSLAGTGDIDGDGRAELLWRNGVNGALLAWYLTDAGTLAGTRDFGAVPTSFELRGTGDLDANGTADLVWFRPTDGQVAVWLMARDGTFTPGFPGAVGASGWRPHGVADFDGDGRSDILWREQASGMTAVWYLDAGVLGDYQFFVSVPLSEWTVGTLGDFDLDTRTDLLWYSPATGNVARWLMQGRHEPATVELLPSVGPGWSMTR
jgi:hypothetical protein